MESIYETSGVLISGGLGLETAIHGAKAQRTQAG